VPLEVGLSVSQPTKAIRPCSVKRQRSQP
jgi:hypothetical protein